eukprot:UN01340
MYGIAVCTHSLHRWGLMVLFFEFSTIFLHCYIFLYYYGYKTFAGQLKILFGISFFFCRIIVGSFVTRECIEAYFKIKPIDVSCIGYKIFAFVVIVNLMFHLLNFYWFWLIVKAAIWGKKPKRKTRKAKRRSTSYKLKHKNGLFTDKMTKNK